MVWVQKLPHVTIIYKFTDLIIECFNIYPMNLGNFKTFYFKLGSIKMLTEFSGTFKTFFFIGNFKTF